MATITKQDRPIPNLSRSVTTIISSDTLLLEQGKAISYANFLTKIGTDLTPSPTGSGGKIDMGERMNGIDRFDCGSRV
jgi:hypothetical protein